MTLPVSDLDGCLLLGIAIPRAAALDVTWTTVHLAVAALRRGHRVRFVEPWDFEVHAKGQLTARAHAFDQPVDAQRLVAKLHSRGADRRYVRVNTFDVLLVRAAPLDPALLSFALMAQDRGVQVVNDPAGMLRTSHKAWLAGLPDVTTPPTLVTQSPGAAQLFYEKHRRPVIVKPARGSGGVGVNRVPRRRPALFDRAFLDARERGGHVVVQVYVDDGNVGEKRLVWMDGEVLGGYVRRRAPGEFRHNLRQGGTPESTTITPEEHALVAKLTPHLIDAGIRLAGLDTIGAHVIEVNTLNPGGTYHADRLHGTDLAGTILERLEASPPRPERSAWARPVP